MKTEKKKTWRYVAAILFIVAVFGAAGIFWKSSQVPSLTYRQEKVERGNIHVTILSTGVVAPENRVDIKAPIPGRAEKVLVEEGKEVKKGQILVWMSSTDRAALLDAARARGAAEYKHWEEYYKPTPVLAPISGTVILRNVEAGQTFTTSDAILAMSDRLTVEAQVDETDIAEVHLKQPAKIVLDAYPKNKISAHVNKIAYDAKTVNNVTTYLVDVLPDEVPDYMRSGMTANVTFDVATRENVLLVTNDAIKNQNGKLTILRAPANEKGDPEPIPVTLGITDGKRTEVISGLTEGETILAPKVKFNQGPATSNPLAPMGGGRRGGR